MMNLLKALSPYYFKFHLLVPINVHFFQFSIETLIANIPRKINNKWLHVITTC